MARKRNLRQNIARIGRFLKAEWDWANAGFCTASVEEVERRYWICRGCEHYQPDDESRETGECGICECNLVNAQIHLSKIARANEVCPLMKWGEAE